MGEHCLIGVRHEQQFAGYAVFETAIHILGLAQFDGGARYPSVAFHAARATHQHRPEVQLVGCKEIQPDSRGTMHREFVRRPPRAAAASQSPGSESGQRSEVNSVPAVWKTKWSACCITCSTLPNPINR